MQQLTKLELIEQLRKLQSPETPYLMTVDENEVRLELNLADKKWIEIASVAGINYIFMYRIVLDEATRTATLETYRRKITWDAGMPMFASTATATAAYEMVRGEEYRKRI